VALGIVQDGPRRAVVFSIVKLDDALAADRGDGGCEIRNFEEEDSLIARGIGFDALAFEADEGRAGGETGVARSVFVEKVQT